MSAQLTSRTACKRPARPERRPLSARPLVRVCKHWLHTQTRGAFSFLVWLCCAINWPSLSCENSTPERVDPSSVFWLFYWTLNCLNHCRQSPPWKHYHLPNNWMTSWYFRTENRSYDWLGVISFETKCSHWNNKLLNLVLSVNATIDQTEEDSSRSSRTFQKREMFLKC